MLHVSRVLVLLLIALVVAAWADEQTENQAAIDKLLRRAGQRSGRGDYEGALADISKLLELDAKSADAYNLRGTAYFNQAKYAEALADYTQAIELNPKHADAYANRGNTHYRMQDYKAAIGDYDKEVELRPESQYAWNRRGVGCEVVGNVMDALTSYDKALALDPKFADAWFNRGDVRRKLGMLKAAIEDYSQAVELEPGRAGYFNTRGLARSQNDDLESGLADLTQALKLEPAMPAAYENRWVIYSRLGQTEAAQNDWDENLKLLPNNEAYLQSLKEKLLPIYKQYPAPKSVDEFLNRGAAFYAGMYYIQAAADYRRASELDDFNPDASFDLGISLSNLGYYDGAIDAYKKCIDADDRYFRALFEAGELYRFRLNQPEEAIKYLDKAIAVKPDYVVAFASRGAAKKTKGDLDGAVKDLDRALELDPKNTFAYWNRGEAELNRKNYDRAIVDLTKASELDPTYSYPLQLRGQAKRAKKDYPGAIADLTAAYNVFKGGYILMHRGLTYLDMGKPAEAQKDFDEALKLYPALKPELDAEIAKTKSGAEKRKGTK